MTSTTTPTIKAIATTGTHRPPRRDRVAARTDLKLSGAEKDGGIAPIRQTSFGRSEVSLSLKRSRIIPERSAEPLGGVGK